MQNNVKISMFKKNSKRKQSRLPDKLYEFLEAKHSQYLHIRTEKETLKGMSNLNKNIHFCNYRLFELFRFSKCSCPVKRRAESSKAIRHVTIDETMNVSVKHVVHKKLLDAYNHFVTKCDKSNFLIRKRFYSKGLKQYYDLRVGKDRKIDWNEIYTPNNPIQEFLLTVKKDLKIALTALYIQGRLRKKSHHKEVKKSDQTLGGFAYAYRNEFGDASVFHMTSLLASAPIHSFELKGWKARTGPRCLEQKMQDWIKENLSTEKLRPKSAEMYSQKRNPKKAKLYCRTLLDLMRSFRNEPRYLEETEYENGINDKDGGKMMRSNYKTVKNREHKTNLEELLQESIELINEEDTVNSEGEEVQKMNNEVKDWKKIKSKVEKYRMGDVFWSSAAFKLPFRGHVIYNHKGKGISAERVFCNKNCLVVMFVNLPEVFSEHVWALDRIFKKSALLQSKVGYLTVVLGGGSLDSALMMATRRSNSWYTKVGGSLASYLLLVCRPRKLPCSFAVDPAGKATSRKALADLLSLGPGSALLKWIHPHSSLSFPDHLGFAEPGTQGLVRFAVRAGCCSRLQPPAHHWEYVLDHHLPNGPTVLRPAT